MFRLLIWLVRLVCRVLWDICFHPAESVQESRREESKHEGGKPGKDRQTYPRTATQDPSLEDRVRATTSAESFEDGHELSDAKPKVIIAVLVGLLLSILAWMAISAAIYMHLYSPRAAMFVKRVQEDFTYAPLQKTSIEDDWTALDAETKKYLDSYSWIDRPHGVIRIPVSRAMQLIASEGLPCRNGQTPGFPPPEDEKLPLTETETPPHAPSNHKYK